MINQEKLLKPADYVIRQLGGLRPAARKIGCHHSSVNKWRWSEKDGGCDGFIPRKVMHKILNLAMKNNWNITAYDLIFGHPIKEK
jgi:hypothetical protein